MTNSNPEVVNNMWANFGDESLMGGYEEPCSTGSLAEEVVNYFNLPSSLGGAGGSLDGLDINHMDALEVIKLSLLEDSANSGFSSIYEVSVNEEGEIEFIAIGQGSAGISDVYYEIQSSTYIEGCVGVMVHGGKSLPVRKPLEWKPIWGSEKPTPYNLTKFTSQCAMPGYNTHATIVFKDPHMSSGESQYNDGINNLYDITEPFESIIGYVFAISLPDNKTKQTNVSLNQESAIIPIKIGEGGGEGEGPYMGVLQPIRLASSGYSSNCWVEGWGAATEDGVEIVIPEEFRYEDIRGNLVDKFVAVEQIFVHGYKIDGMHVSHKSGVTPNSPLTKENSKCVLTINDYNKSMHKLEEGRQFVINYPEGDGTNPVVIFARSSLPGDPMEYGQNTPYTINPFCEAASIGMEGFDPESSYNGSILPVEGNTGFLVEEIFALVKINTPSITVTDPHQNDNPGESLAYDIADGLDFQVAAVVVDDPPAPIAFNGDIIDQSEGVADKDPTTQEDFEDTPLEQAMDIMGSGQGLTLNLSFIKDEGKLADISSNLYNYMNGTDGTETTYVCGPNATPKLGANGNSGGVINSITYSYSDSSAYTISVNEGPKIPEGFSGVSFAPTYKATESLNAKGTIIGDLGNGIHYKVRIDSIGNRIAVNMCPEFLRKGDIVNCAVYNIPVEA
jgi:hypothetical protein